jgi:hypothetical protein
MVGMVAAITVYGWFLLESVKDWFSGVDPTPLGQHVPPRVWYETTFLLMWQLWVCVLFESNEEGYDYT